MLCQCASQLTVPGNQNDLVVFQGMAVMLTVLAVFGVSLYRGYGDTEARAPTFTTLIVGVISLIFVNRSRSRGVIDAIRSPNRAFWWVVCGALGFLATVLSVRYLRDVFRFGALDLRNLAVCLSAAMINLTALTGVKSFRNHAE